MSAIFQQVQNQDLFGFYCMYIVCLLLCVVLCGQLLPATNQSTYLAADECSSTVSRLLCGKHMERQGPYRSPQQNKVLEKLSVAQYACTFFAGNFLKSRHCLGLFVSTVCPHLEFSCALKYKILMLPFPLFFF